MINFYLIDLISQAYAVSELLANNSETDILKWLRTKGKISERKELSSDFHKVFEFNSHFELRSHINFQAVFFINDGQFIFLGDRTTFSFH